MQKMYFIILWHVEISTFMVKSIAAELLVMSFPT